ncbi:MAG TPA: CocE/NonD family hydrolase C-terminal non-catalytic domain-containing protein, partial [Acidimicrobiales bacterium]|nr:CocE/NonD family hydrolase C-terminal non-catalytic domain-containing protein [Acidimicrobiales bacterium]
LNDGFATEWVAQREASAEPAGQSWAANRIAAGDETCEENQRLKLQAPPLVARFERDLPFEADPGDDLAPATFVDEIEVPTFIAGAFQDEQTGGHWPTMLDDFDTPGEADRDLKRAILYNGTHADAAGPDVLRDLLEFLDLYVARQAPRRNVLLRGEAPEQLDGTFGAPYMLPPRRDIFSHAQYEAEGDVILRWERGARDAASCIVEPDPPLPPGPFGEPTPRACIPDGEGDGSLFGRFESSWETWPPPGLTGGAPTAATWFLQPDAGLGASAPTIPDDQPRGASSYAYDPSRSQVMNFAGSSTDIWHKDATYTWEQPPEPNSLRFVSAAFGTTRAFAGTGSVDLWVRAGAPDTDLEVTLTELRPDGSETYVQSGWLRASHRAEAPSSTPLDVQRTYTAEDVADLPVGEFSRARVEIFPFAHIVRPGSRLALTVAAPGGNRPLWRFDALPAPADPTVELGHSVGHPSRLTLPEVALPTGAAGSTLPVCGDLRSQPCREVTPSTRPTAVSATIDPGDTAADLDRGMEVTWTAPAATPVTGNHVLALPSGEEHADADASPGHRLSIPVGEPPPTDVAYAVESDIDGDRGVRSNASPEVVPEHPFTDVPRTAWNVDAVDWVAAWHLAAGFDDDTFRNGAKATRGQVITWIWSTFGRPTEGSGTAFADTAGVVREAARWARGNGIASGFAGNRFRPGQRVTRAQAVAWLWAAAGRPDVEAEHGFTDVPASAWYGDALDWADEARIVTGFAGDTYRPSSDVARGQIAGWLHATAQDLQAT